MILFPGHLETIDHYVQSMPEDEERSQNAPTQHILGISVDVASHNDVCFDKTNPTKMGELQMVNGIRSMVTTHIRLPDPSNPVDQSQNVSGYCSPSPGGKSQVFRTPWTGIRTGKITFSRYYGGTPSDRYSSHTASPDIVKTNIDHHAACHDASSKRSPSQNYVDSYGTDSGEKTELTAENDEGRSQFATEGESIQGQDELNFSS
ncbi:hypothetical protein BWQ96_04169 [Gracilariopsis chorda]|uniref:Uncharacterized protein n=1 Tax=Gracilariopsis chorda TaxID=448386 RepID=A0A2V3IVF2_9FLOR|nr:hypothetical protein BWQ96_04169 [Gracilariopsis chorda]|eukprot:PXF46069.1 hypothetical protein BWQ96_04169 [Gracilariopsis chorda]